MPSRSNLDQDLLTTCRRQIESLMVPAMEALYGEPPDTSVEPFHAEQMLPASVRHGYKPIERIVSYFDYAATGISVLAPLAADGDEPVRALVADWQSHLELAFEPVPEEGV